MTLSADPDRFAHEDNRPSPYERDVAAEKLAKLEALKERFAEQARAFAEGVKAIDADLIQRWEFATRSKSMTHAEAIEGFVQTVADNASDLLCGDVLESLANLSEGRDDD